MKHLVKIQGLCGIVFIICFDTIDFEVQKESQTKLLNSFVENSLMVEIMQR